MPAIERQYDPNIVALLRQRLSRCFPHRNYRTCQISRNFSPIETIQCQLKTVSSFIPCRPNNALKQSKIKKKVEQEHKHAIETHFETV